MFTNMGDFFADRLKRFIPDAFVFAILLTVITAALAIIWVDKTPFDVIQSWYRGFWMLLEFGMQVVLLLATGYAIAISPPAAWIIDRIADKIKTPVMVYVFVVFIGQIFSLVSWGWLVLTAVLARELATRVRNINYPFLTACVYFSMGSWVCGLSSSIPLLLNTEGNFLIKGGVLASQIPISSTLGSTINIVLILVMVLISPILMVVLRPTRDEQLEIDDLRDEGYQETTSTVAEEAEKIRLPGRSISDTLNNSLIIQIVISIMGLWYILWHFLTNGFDINLNIMIFVFIVTGMICHRSAVRYVIAMKRACSNVSGIVFQYPFYAGIMGIMIHTGLGSAIGIWIADVASVSTFPLIAFLVGGAVNFAIPSAGGEWAVLGPTIVETARNLTGDLPAEQVTAFIARVSMAVAYGESLTNVLQPFFLLIILPVMGAGVRLQARDVMGYLIVPFLCFFIIEAIIVTWVPM